MKDRLRAGGALPATAASSPAAHPPSPDGEDTIAIPVFVVVPPRLLLLDIAGPIEVLRQANRVQNKVRFDVSYVGPGTCIQTSIGIALSGIQPLPASLPGAAWVVLGGDVEEVMQSGGGAMLGKSMADAADERVIVEWLRAAIRPGHILISICTGAFLAARAGLLDDFSCTTHHVSCDELARIAPRTRVLENRLFVQDGARHSSAGITAGIDLMLHLIRQAAGQACAAAVARFLVVYIRRNGSDPQLSPWLEGRNHVHPGIHRVQDFIAADLTKSWSLHRLAQIAGTGERHLSRLFHTHVGMSVLGYGNCLRVAHAQMLLRETRLDMERVAEQAGFGSARQLHRTWRKLHQTPPSAARQRAGSKGWGPGLRR